jgi:hypothetical protein
MLEPGISQEVDARTFAEQPQQMVWQSANDSLAMDADQVAEIQLGAVRNRFVELHDKLVPLANLAAKNGINDIRELNDAASLLFKHSVYKSYPVSLIEKGRFDRLTAWLGNLTTADLSMVRTEGLASIDDWLDALLRDAGVRIIHTTGTSGKLSFLPRGELDEPLQLRSGRLSQEVVGKPEPRGLDRVPTIVVGHRKMFNGYGANIDALVEHLYGGDESMILTMDPGRLSADVLSLAGRLAAAENRGELGRSQISPAILNRLDQFVEAQKSAPERRARFFDAVFDRLKGCRVMMAGNWSMYLEMMEAGRERGADHLFSPASHFLCAGGTKGKVMPDNFRNDIADFLGVDCVAESYGMSEMSALMPKCERGKYHALPWMLVFVLDPATGQPAPRSGTHTGRFGVIDLAYQQRWGGVLSGDEVTMTFGRCECGRDGPFIAEGIRRYSEIEGGDDKITCAGAPEAHDNALAFLAELD